MIRTATAISLVFLAGGLAPAAAASPDVYPANACVSTKQETAGDLCRAVFEAWSKWETSQDAADRDAAILAAAVKLGDKWTKADAKALGDNVDCAETTLTPSAASGLVDSAIAAIVDDVNAGLNLGNAKDAKCGAKILKAAGKKCDALLGAESRHIEALAKDPERTALDAARAKASDKFAAAFDKQLDKGCPTVAEASAVETSIDDLVADLVRDTTVSPNVDDAAFTAYSPTGPIDYLGKALSPTCINGSPYTYFAKRGSENKLLVYYQGGGACWEQLTCSLPACDTSVVPSDNPQNAMSGFADRNNPANPFRDWNIVFVSYCSCDIHFGDAAQDYDNFNPASPIHVEHRGFHNARVVEKWAREHFLDPEVVFVTGSSAGAYGAWFHAPLLQLVWPASQFHVLADAGNGVVTQSFLEDFFPNWNFAGNIPPEFPEFQAVIEEGTGIVGYTELITSRLPAVHWAHYSTAFDGGSGGQTGFYNIMLNDNNPIAALTWWDGSCAFNEKMREQALEIAAAVPDNYRYYIGTGSRHTMWGSNKVYTDTTGGVPTLVDWVNAMLNGSTAWTNVECTNCGLLLPGDPRPSPLEPPFQMIGSDTVIVCSPGGAFLDGGGGFD